MIRNRWRKWMSAICVDQMEIRRYLVKDEKLENEAKVDGVGKKNLVNDSEPSVVDLNGIIASLGVQELNC